MGQLREQLREQVWRIPGEFVLALFFCAPAFAAPYPTADQLRSAIGEITAQAKSEHLEVEILDAQQEGVTRPLMAASLSLDDGVCVIYYNSKPEDGLIQLFDAMPSRDVPIWLNSVAVHEIAHCVEKREAYIRHRFDKVLPPGYALHEPTIQGYSSVIKSGVMETWGEALADIASILYFQQAVPDRWEELSNRLIDMRSNLARKWPEHDNSDLLRKIVAAKPAIPANQSLYEASFQLRQQFSTGNIARTVSAVRAAIIAH